jgi:ubiquinone/menaquinone biosynthesis C-methylase UbiE
VNGLLTPGWTLQAAQRSKIECPIVDNAEAVRVNRIFHDHESAYYDERFAIVHDQRSACRALQEVEDLLGRPIRARETVVDVGCGTGWLAAGLSRAMPGLPVIGIDLSQGMLEHARAAGAWPLLRADAQRLPLATASADLIVTRGVLHHLPDVPAALTEWRRVLRPGGAVVVTCEPTPALEAHVEPLVRALLWVLHRPLSPEENFWEVASMAANLHVFTPARLAAMATGAGYREVSLSTGYFCTTLLLAASYVTHGRRRGLARWVPWRWLYVLASTLDGAVANRVLPNTWRHAVVGVLRP